jgi:hypothetical protein
MSLPPKKSWLTLFQEHYNASKEVFDLNMPNDHAPHLTAADGARLFFENCVSLVHNALSGCKLDVRRLCDSDTGRRILIGVERRGALQRKAIVTAIQMRNGRCTLELANYRTRMHTDQVRAAGSAFKVAALALLRGARDATVVVYTAGERWDFRIERDGRLTLRTQTLDIAPGGRVLDPQHHTTTVIGWHSHDNNSVLAHMLPRDLYAPFVRAAAWSAPLLLGRDVVKSDAFLLLLPNGGSHAGGVYVSHFLKARGAVPYAAYRDNKLVVTARLAVRDIAPYFVRRIDAAIVRETIDQSAARALVDIVAFRLRNVESAQPRHETLWDSLVESRHCRHWFAEQFRVLYPGYYPCATADDVRALLDNHIDVAPMLVSHCFYRLLTAHPEDTGYSVLDVAAERSLLASPILVFNDDDEEPQFLRTLAEMVDLGLRQCGLHSRVRFVAAHAASPPPSQTLLLTLDKSGALHCPESLLRMPLDEAVGKAFQLIVRMPQIAASRKPADFEEKFRLLVPRVREFSDNNDAAVASAAVEERLQRKRTCASRVEPKDKRVCCTSTTTPTTTTACLAAST